MLPNICQKRGNLYIDDDEVLESFNKRTLNERRSQQKSKLP